MTKLMTHVVAGYPDFEKSLDLIKTLSSAGSDYIEIQFPFSDPIADGETIQIANIESINAGATINSSFELINAVKDIESELIIMTYFNIIFTHGIPEFCKQAAEANCTGFIVPDLPFDSLEFDSFKLEAEKCGLKIFYVVSPLISDARLDKVLQVATGFIYCISQLGTTGGSFQLDHELEDFVCKLRSKTDLPVALGFGIRNKQHVEKAMSIADIAVIGSQIIREYNKNGLEGIEGFVSNIKSE